MWLFVDTLFSAAAAAADNDDDDEVGVDLVDDTLNGI